MKKLTSRLAAAFLLLWLIPQTAAAAQLLIPGGQIIGLELGSDLTVAAFDETLGTAAQSAGLAVGDQITSIDGKPVTSAQDVRQALDRSDGTVELEILRDGKCRNLTLSPQITEDGPRLGVYLRQGITGVGTVTYFDPGDGCFGALGHGVNSKAGCLLAMDRGCAYPARVASVKKGECGTPGQLMGTLTDRTPIGTLNRNTAQGVFGQMEGGWPGEALPVAETDEIRTGPATIRSTVEGNCVQEYSVEILKIYPQSRENGRNLLIKITDPDLLATTGGIVQGMSGSPIIQNGAIIGAVTHVLVNDPTTGYGIFIENMLDAAG